MPVFDTKNRFIPVAGELCVASAGSGMAIGL